MCPSHQPAPPPPNPKAVFPHGLQRKRELSRKHSYLDAVFFLGKEQDRVPWHRIPMIRVLEIPAHYIYIYVFWQSPNPKPGPTVLSRKRAVGTAEACEAG